MFFGPTIWVDILGNDAPLFPYKYPALFSMPAAFRVTWAVSKLDRARS
jgi:cation/acetate symporter